MTSASPANEFVTDTMALVLRVERRRMGERAKAAFEALEAGAATIHVPGIVLAEILYLSERGRLSASVEKVAEYMRRNPNCKEAPLNLAVIQAARAIADIPELHDRLIAATGRLLGLQVITIDPAIQSSEFVGTLW
ncbi:MAG: type II toxin-antitoxin system VapC family toxin [Planctomycetes bacterium]|nr:type II toxin-antitoxin system VapC family toxin [Planctomycetota bacterium]